MFQARTDALIASGAVREPPGVKVPPTPPTEEASTLKGGTTRKSDGGYEWVVVNGKWIRSADADPCAPQFYTAFLDYELATWSVKTIYYAYNICIADAVQAFVQSVMRAIVRDGCPAIRPVVHADVQCALLMLCATIQAWTVEDGERPLL